jgi:hypothetical protein
MEDMVCLKNRIEQIRKRWRQLRTILNSAIGVGQLRRNKPELAVNIGVWNER